MIQKITHSEILKNDKILGSSIFLPSNTNKNMDFSQFNEKDLLEYSSSHCIKLEWNAEEAKFLAKFVTGNTLNFLQISKAEGDEESPTEIPDDETEEDHKF